MSGEKDEKQSLEDRISTIENRINNIENLLQRISNDLINIKEITVLRNLSLPVLAYQFRKAWGVAEGYKGYLMELEDYLSELQESNHALVMEKTKIEERYKRFTEGYPEVNKHIDILSRRLYEKEEEIKRLKLKLREMEKLLGEVKTLSQEIGREAAPTPLREELEEELKKLKSRYEAEAEGEGR